MKNVKLNPNLKKTVYLTIAPPGGGKSFWVRLNKLQPYTISSDDLRCLYSVPTSNISQKYNKEVWKLLYELVECRVADGTPIVIIDSCNCKESYFNKIHSIVNHFGYEVVGINFSIDIEQHYENNECRESWRYVPRNVIDDMNKSKNIFLQNNKKYRIIDVEQAEKEILHKDELIPF